MFLVVRGHILTPDGPTLGSSWRVHALSSSALVAGARPKDLTEMIDRAIKLDNYQRERRRERVFHSISPRSPLRSRPSPRAPVVSSPVDPQVQVAPMQLGRAHLFPSQRCWLLTPAFTVAKWATLLTPVSAQRRSSLEVFSGDILISFIVSFLVNSGVDNSFPNETLAKQASIPHVELSDPHTVRDLNGRTIALVTHRTGSLTLLASDNHHEQIQLFIIPSDASPAVLGSPWLASRYSQIDWTTSSISTWSVACHVCCLRSALPPASLDRTSPSPVVDLRLPRLKRGLLETTGSLTSTTPTLRLCNRSTPWCFASCQPTLPSLQNRARGHGNLHQQVVGLRINRTTVNGTLWPCIDYRGLGCQYELRRQKPWAPELDGDIGWRVQWNL